MKTAAGHLSDATPPIPMTTRHIFKYVIPACMAVAAFGALVSQFLSDDYHGNALVFTYERYEQILPYTFNPAGREWAGYQDTLRGAKSVQAGEKP